MVSCLVAAVVVVLVVIERAICFAYRCMVNCLVIFYQLMLTACLLVFFLAACSVSFCKLTVAARSLFYVHYDIVSSTDNSSAGTRQRKRREQLQLFGLLGELAEMFQIQE